MNFKKCSHTARQKFFSVKENNRIFRIRNKSYLVISQVKVDGCLIDDHRKQRCDYLFEIDDPFTSVIYVELKGADIKKASKQLGATIGYCKKRHARLPLSCHIVASRVPRSTPGTQVLRKKFPKQFGASLTISTTFKEISV